MNHIYFTKFRAQIGKGSDLFALLTEVANYMKTYPRCSEYRVFKDAEDNDVVCVLESWLDDTSHKESLNDSRVKEMVTRGIPLIDKMLGQEKLLG